MWVEITAKNGKRMLLNLVATFCITENDKGGAVAVSTAGVSCEVPDTPYDDVRADLVDEDEDEGAG